MDTLKRAIDYVRQIEGELSEDPDDPGGTTKYGISLRHAIAVGDIDGDGIQEFDFNLDGKVTADDIRMMTPEQADHWYHHLYNSWRIGEIQEAAIAIKIYDYHFPVGPGGAGRIVQRALRACDHRVVEDGVIGSKTIAAINAVYPPYLMIALRSEGAGFFRSLRSKKYENGWLNRAYNLPHMETPNGV